MFRFLLPALVLAVALTAGCRARVTEGGAGGSKPDAARKQAETLAVNAVNGAAAAQANALAIPISIRTGKQPQPVVVAPSVPEMPQPRALPRPGPSPIIHTRVISPVPLADEKDAEVEAINAACDLIERRLAELDPPVHYRPTAFEVEKEFLRRDSRTVTLLKDAKGERADAMRRVLKDELRLSPEEIARRVDVEYDVEVTADQVRHLRTRDRVGDALRVFGALVAVAVAGFLFLRADEWTKGYLTRWLAMGAVLMAGGAAAALYFV
jgi:hypothetical protein